MLLRKFYSFIYFMLCFFSGVMLFIGCEGKEQSELNKTVRTENLSGLNLFLASTYNNNRLMFALISTGSIVILGLIVMYIIGLFINPKHHIHKEE